MRHWIEEYNQLGSNATRDQLTESGSQGVSRKFYGNDSSYKGLQYLKGSPDQSRYTTWWRPRAIF